VLVENPADEENTKEQWEEANAKAKETSKS
jgi:hypothetical protein